jgi:hypothetical protein
MTKGSIRSMNKTRLNFIEMIKKRSLLPAIPYFLFALAYFIWVMATYRNIVHMDMIHIIATKLGHLYEHDLGLRDLFYEPLSPALMALLFTYGNALFFHLNTVIEIAAGAVLLILLGYYYLRNIDTAVLTEGQQALFALLIGFIVFGLHKWEASLTSFFSFAVFFDMCLCFLNYFFIIKYVGEDDHAEKKYHIPFLILSNLLVILDEPSYFYGYLLSVTIVMILLRRVQFFDLNKKRWNQIFILNGVMLLLTIAISTVLSDLILAGSMSSGVSPGNFLKIFLQKPAWMIKFYLIANSGPFLGELQTHIELRALAGLFIIVVYGAAVYYVVKRRDKRLLVPILLIFYNLISYGFVTMARYTFNTIQYGTASRYTAFNLSGVLGLVTILFFCGLLDKNKTYRIMAGFFLIAILIGYARVDKKQLDISPYRTAAFRDIRQALLTGENLDILQASPEDSRQAIVLLKRYGLNVYSGSAKEGASQDLGPERDIFLAAGDPRFERLVKTGFYAAGNGISWTNGNACLFFGEPILIKDSLVLDLDTYMPPKCAGIYPKVSITDTGNKEYLPGRSIRNEDLFHYVFLNGNTPFQKINIRSDTIDALPDRRTLSFPFKSLEIRR